MTMRFRPLWVIPLSVIKKNATGNEYGLNITADAIIPLIDAAIHGVREGRVTFVVGVLGSLVAAALSMNHANVAERQRPLKKSFIKHIYRYRQFMA